MTSFFVTGASSALGASVVDGLRAHGRVTALRHRSAVRDDVDIVDGELNRLSGVGASIAAADVVVHMAACTRADDESAYRRVNVDGTADLLDQCRSGQHLVYVSSRTAGSDGGGYARTKLEAEQLVLERFPTASILRVGEVVMPGSTEGISSLLGLAARRRVLVDFRDHGPVRYAPIEADAVRDAIVNAAVRNVGGTVVVAMTCHVSSRDFRVAFNAAGRRVITAPVPVWLLRRLQPLLVPRVFVGDQLDRLTSEKECATPAELAALGVDPPNLSHLVQSVLDDHAAG